MQHIKARHAFNWKKSKVPFPPGKCAFDFDAWYLLPDQDIPVSRDSRQTHIQIQIHKQKQKQAGYK